MSVIADTDVVSFFFKEDSRTALYKPHFFAIPKFISFMTLAELRRWQRQSSWGMMKTRKFEELIADFGVIFADEELCDVWARVKMDAQQKNAVQSNPKTLGLPLPHCNSAFRLSRTTANITKTSKI